MCLNHYRSSESHNRADDEILGDERR